MLRVILWHIRIKVGIINSLLSKETEEKIYIYFYFLYTQHTSFRIRKCKCDRSFPFINTTKSKVYVFTFLLNAEYNSTDVYIKRPLHRRMGFSYTIFCDNLGIYLKDIGIILHTFSSGMKYINICVSSFYYPQ